MDVIIVTMLFGVLGIMIGWKAGNLWGASAQTDKQYWLRNAAAVGVGVVLSALVTATGLVTLVGFAIGLIGGAVAGLKMGYGKSVGLWQKHDSLFRVNRDDVAAAKSARAARDAGQTEEERAARDLISIGAQAPEQGQADAARNKEEGR